MVLQGGDLIVKADLYALGPSQVAHEILTYLVEHPDAQDTLKGIVQWWLLEQNIKLQTVKVKEVLAELVAKGLVLEHKGRDSQARYRINQSKYEEIQAFLKQRIG